MFLRGLAFSCLVLCASLAQAATVKFSGNFNLLFGGGDVLNIQNKPFLATFETDNATNILSGQVWLAPANVTASQVIGITGGTVAVGGGNTTFTANGGGGVLTFSITGQAPALDQAGLFAIMGNGGVGTWIVGASTYVTGAAITVVPEPTSTLALFGLVSGVIGFGRRRRLG